MSIIGHIDLYSPPLKILIYLLYLDPKSTPIDGNCIPSLPALAVSVDGNFHCNSMAWRLLIDLREYMYMTPPKYSIYGRKWTFWRSRMVTWPSFPDCPICLSWSEIWMEKHQTYVSLFGNLYISNLFKNKMKKNVWKHRETVSSLGTGKQFYIFVTVGYYPLLS